MTVKITDLRPFLDGLLPDSPLWKPVPGGDFDNFLQALSEMYKDQAERSRELGLIRSAMETPWLEELERDYGIRSLEQLAISESRRRAILAAIQSRSGGAGPNLFLQNLLQDAGFPVEVFDNSPPISPAALLSTSSGSSYDYSNAFYDFEDGYYGSFTPEILTNGDYYSIKVNNISSFDGDAFYDNGDALYDFYEEAEVLDEDFVNIFDIPRERWKYIFCIGLLGTTSIDWIQDPDMEYPTASAWTIGEDSLGEKVPDVFAQGGVRSLKISGGYYLDSQNIDPDVLDTSLIASWEMMGRMHKDDEEGLHVYAILPPVAPLEAPLVTGDLDFSELDASVWEPLAEFYTEEE